jgi:quinol monooxygenase YgiN
VACASVPNVFALVVRFDLPDAAAARTFDELTAAAVPLIHAHEPGTLVYETYGIDGEPLARLFYEVYRNRDAHAEHERQPHTATFLATIATLVTQTRVEYLSRGSQSDLAVGLGGR